MTLRNAEKSSKGTATKIPAESAQSVPPRHGILEQISAPAGTNLMPPRWLVVLAHPDDEVLALGGRLERLGSSRLLCVTDGAPEDGQDARAHGFATLEDYREARRRELEVALKLGGLPAGRAQPLVVRGPEGTELRIADQRAAYHLAGLTRAVAHEIERFRPEAVLTHPYEGGHPDHDGCAFAVHTAVRLLTGSVATCIVEAPFYHARDNGREEQKDIETGRFLRSSSCEADGPEDTVICELSAEEQARKRERLACFVTQRETLAQFGTEREQFRIAPSYDFAKAPHEGRLFYEGFPWGISGHRFRELAAAALQELGLRRSASGSRRA